MPIQRPDFMEFADCLVDHLLGGTYWTACEYGRWLPSPDADGDDAVFDSFRTRIVYWLLRGDEGDLTRHQMPVKVNQYAWAQKLFGPGGPLAQSLVFDGQSLSISQFISDEALAETRCHLWRVCPPPQTSGAISMQDLEKEQDWRGYIATKSTTKPGRRPAP